MVLSRIVPGRLKFDLRTFECFECDHIEKVLVAIDPIQSNVLGWFLGELRGGRRNGAPQLAATRSSEGEPPSSNLAVAPCPPCPVQTR